MRSERLLDYLGKRLETRGLHYAVPLEPIPHGWEAATCSFTVAGPGCPDTLRRPLILRQYASAAGTSRARREFLIQRQLWARGFPVAEPLLLEENAQLLGGPFLVMARVAGQQLLATLESGPHRLWDLPARMAATLAALHALPVAPAPAASCYDRHLDDIEAFVTTYRLRGLTAGLDWLRANVPAGGGDQALLHVDFHPLNLICTGSGLVVLDWDSADVGDPWADVANTCMMIDCAPALAAQAGYPRWALDLARGILRRRFLRAYCRLREGYERERFRYLQAWAALRRLCLHGRVLQAGPAVIGSMPTSLSNLSQDYLDGLCRYFERRSGVHATLSMPASGPARAACLPFERGKAKLVT
ncbi:MAG: phosphotransferase [Gemmataceae bacterium]